MNTHNTRTIPTWNLAVAEHRGTVKWQCFNGALFLRARSGNVYRVRKLPFGAALTPVPCQGEPL